MVQDLVWIQAGMRWHAVHDDGGGCCGILCIGCLEHRIGRQLTPADFVSNAPDRWDTPRLASRKAQ